MAPTEKDNDEDVKLLYACLAYNSTNDIDMDNVAKFLGIQKGAAAKRFSRLKEKLAKAYKTGNKTAVPTISTGKSAGKKRGLKMEEEPTPSKKKVKAATVAAEDDDDEGDDEPENLEEDADKE